MQFLFFLNNHNNNNKTKTIQLLSLHSVSETFSMSLSNNVTNFSTSKYHVHIPRPYFDAQQGYYYTACDYKWRNDLLIAGYLREKAQAAILLNGSSLISLMKEIIIIIQKNLNESHIYQFEKISLSTARQGVTIKMAEIKAVLTDDWLYGNYPNVSKWTPQYKGDIFRQVGYVHIQMYITPKYVIPGIHTVTSNIGVRFWYHIYDSSGYNATIGRDLPIDIAGFKLLTIKDEEQKIKYSFRFGKEHKYLIWQNESSWKLEDEQKQSYYDTGYFRKEHRGDPIEFDLRNDYVITLQIVNSLPLHHIEEGVIINHKLDAM